MDVRSGRSSAPNWATFLPGKQGAVVSGELLRLFPPIGDVTNYGAHPGGPAGDGGAL